VRFGVLGPVAAWADDGTALPTGGPGLRALLALLALSAGQVVGPERLIDGLYGEHPPDNAANALQSQVSRLRRGLGVPGVIELTSAGYRLAVDPAEVDALRFETLVREGRQAAAVSDHAGAVARLAEALDLWRGPALADVLDVPFAPVAAARLAEHRAAAIEDRAEAELATGDHRAAVPALQELTAEHPLRERARALLMRALHGSGRTAEALLVFEDARRVLAEELGADPGAELTAVHLALLRGSVDTPAAGVLPPLPAQLTSFVGRSGELARIGALLAAGRLVTLTGPGGAGKTRLAIEAGGRQAGEVCFVDLAPIGAGVEVPMAVLAALGLREAGLLGAAGASGAPAPPPLRRLTAALAGRRLLLILDNCEHVLDEAAGLTHRLLGGCPQLRVLATSREPLGITGEALCPVARLGTPTGETSAEAAVDYPAVRLFADRAAAVRADFAVHAGNLAAVLRICTALDGLPLAIELAAARLRSLPVSEVAGRLDDRFRLLSRGDRTAAPRHRTLRAVVEWSWGLLDPSERWLAQRLTVFAGGATVPAVASVCGLDPAGAADLLASLVDKSLLEPAGERYRMLDTVRAYGAERLAESGAEDALRRAHASYFLALALEAGPWLRRAEQVEWLARLSAEQANLQAALRWAVAADPALALRLTAAQCWYWYLRGLTSEGTPLARELLARLGSSPAPPADLADLAEEYVLTVLAATGLTVDRPPELAEPLRRATEYMDALDRPPREPALLVLWAVTTGPPPPDADVAEARDTLVGDDPWSNALIHISAGFQRLFGGDLAGAEAPFAAALAAFRAIGDRWGIAGALGQLGMLAYLRGDPATTRTLATEAIELVSEMGAGEDLADLLCGRADAAELAGDRPAARADYQLAAECARRSGAITTLARAQSGLGDLARRDGALADARRLQEAALASCPPGSFGVNNVRSQILVAYGRTCEASGALSAAGTAYREALSLGLAQWHLPITAGAVCGLAGLALRAGHPDRAAVLLGAAERLRGAPLSTDPEAAAVATRLLPALGADGYAAALARGAALPPAELLTYLDS
jgi:predicted ATPase/DNA-binding SARP family transcriptional activator